MFGRGAESPGWELLGEKCGVRVMEEFGSAFLGNPEQSMRGGSGGLVVCHVPGKCASAFRVVRDARSWAQCAACCYTTHLLIA